MKNVLIRNEMKGDYKVVEALVQDAFYNIYIPGCVEHYLVHLMREHEDFIPELDLVLRRMKAGSSEVSCIRRLFLSTGMERERRYSRLARSASIRSSREGDMADI